MKPRITPLPLLCLLSLCACDVHDVKPVRSADGGDVGDLGPRADGDVQDGSGDARLADGVAPSAPCISNGDCATDAPLCDYTTGVCAAATAPYCGLPPAPRASPNVRVLGESCSFPESGYTPNNCPAPCTEGFACEAGLVCVPSLWAIKTGGTDYETLGGICLEACDPCATAGSCAVGRECYAMQSGGGFCHPSPLAQLGQASPLGICAQPPMAQTPVSGVTCKRSCRPDDPNVEMGGATTSPDCPAGQLCTMNMTFLSGWDGYLCTEGSFAPWGTLCGSGKFCPVSCQSCGTNVRVCSPDCGSEPCPDGLSCFDIDDGVNVSKVCIRDGAIPYRGYCAEDRNCEAGLRCVADAAVPRIKKCVL